MTSGNSKKAASYSEVATIAKFFGFKPSVSPTSSKKDFEVVKGIANQEDLVDIAAIFRSYFEEKKNLPQYAFAYFEKPFPGSKDGGGKRNGSKINSYLFSLGSAKYISEGLAIEAGMAILGSIGYKDLELRINSIGDRDSMNAFQKNLSLFLKKNFNSFPADLRQELKKNQFALLQGTIKEEWKKFQKDCPKPIDFLSESSRAHFKEVLEFLEIMDVGYMIDSSLLSNQDVGAETVFSIRENDIELARGYRLNRIAKRIGFKKDVPCMVLDIVAKSKKPLKTVSIKQARPKFYLVQFGVEARIKSFLALKELFKAKVSLMHALERDRLGDQMSFAERSGAPYIILMGQREALDNSVVIRNTMTRAQEIVPISNLAQRAKELP